MGTNKPSFLTPEDIQRFTDQGLPEKATYQDLLNLGGTYHAMDGKVVVPTEDEVTSVRYATDSTEVSGPPDATSWWVMESFTRL